MPTVAHLAETQSPSTSLSSEMSSLVANEARRRGLAEEHIVDEALASYFRGNLSDDDKYKQDYYRREVVHEFNLLNQRLTWYVTCLSLLITSIALVMTTKEWEHRGEFSVALVILGIVLSALTIIAVEQAVKVIEGWQKKEIELRGEIDLANPTTSQARWIPFVVKKKKRRKRSKELVDQIHRRSLLLPRLIAPLFIIALIAITTMVLKDIPWSWCICVK